MREIKFRVWDGMIYWSIRKAIDNGLVGVQYDDSFQLESFYEDVVIEQYTGLKDKNGKEWFEGDKSEAEEGVYCVVVFEEGSFCFAWYEITERHGAEYIETTKMTDYHYDGMEIIGNIHEAEK